MAAVAVTGCGASPDRSSEIASRIGGGASCTETAYGITVRADNSKERIYSCSDLDGNVNCYVEAGGLVQKETDLVRLLFTNVVGSDKPDCI